MRSNILVLSSLAVALILFGCGGGGADTETLEEPTTGGTTDGVTSGLSDCNQAGYNIYLGYYNEDPQNNPEDPTSGFLVACMPDTDGSFVTQFLFSYSGCQGGIDTGTVNGNRTGNSVDGTWSGNVDGQNIGGSFSGSWDGTKFSGTWNNSSGKIHIQIGDCEYYVAGNGTWVLYGLDTDFGGLNINVSVSNSTVSVSWNNSIADVTGFLIGFYDKQCVYDNISLADCTVWSVICSASVNSLEYGTLSTSCQELYSAQSLVSGKDYIVVISAHGTFYYDIRAFASKVFTY